ncbi:hypothetical protein C8R45DRAFT_1009718 [Mycena sanguinolenta]|nr:hypothetical protein C8R45DRAFT_1009718 [Mycena sanguinolenta]
MDSRVFPAELEREIFETAALLDSRAIPSLLRVARRVLEWIEPFLYRVVVIYPWSKGANACHSALARKPNLLAKSVQRLFVGHSTTGWSDEDILALLQLCAPRLSCLVLFNTRLQPAALLPIFSHMKKLRQWMGSLLQLFDDHSAVGLHLSAFRTITHMHLLDFFTTENAAVICAGLAALPCFTHLCVGDSTVLRDCIPRILAQCVHLQVIILMGHSPKQTADSPPTRNVRFVVSALGDIRKDWEVGARGNTDLWAAADEFIARKRRGEIEASCYLLDHFQG